MSTFCIDIISQIMHQVQTQICVAIADFPAKSSEKFKTIKQVSNSVLSQHLLGVANVANVTKILEFALTASF